VLVLGEQPDSVSTCILRQFQMGVLVLDPESHKIGFFAHELVKEVHSLSPPRHHKGWLNDWRGKAQSTSLDASGGAPDSAVKHSD